MTKLLYIPNGEYLKFWYNHQDLMSDDFEYMSSFGNEHGWVMTAEECLEDLISDGEAPDSNWYELNHIEDGHTFLRVELEIIND